MWCGVGVGVLKDEGGWKMWDRRISGCGGTRKGHEFGWGVDGIWGRV